MASPAATTLGRSSPAPSATTTLRPGSADEHMYAHDDGHDYDMKKGKEQASEQTMKKVNKTKSLLKRVGAALDTGIDLVIGVDQVGGRDGPGYPARTQHQKQNQEDGADTKNNKKNKKGHKHGPKSEQEEARLAALRETRARYDAASADQKAALRAQLAARPVSETVMRPAGGAMITSG